MHRPYSLLRFITGCALASASAIAAANCPDRIGEVTVTSAQISPQVSREKSASTLTELAQASRPGFADGLTDVQFGYNIELTPGRVIEGCKSWDIEARLKANEATVYIASEVPENSCRWEALVDHELKHVQIGQRALDSGAKILRERIARSTGTFPAPDANARPGTVELRPWLQTQAIQALDFTIAQYRRNNDFLDKPAEGKRLADKCDMSLQFYMGSDMKRVK